MFWTNWRAAILSAFAFLTASAEAQELGRVYEAKDLNIKMWIEPQPLDYGSIELGEELLPGGEGAFAWTPDGANHNFTSADCTKEVLAAGFRQSVDPLAQAEALREYLARCEDQISRPNDPVPTLLRFALLGLPV